jgi:hypothetical protein
MNTYRPDQFSIIRINNAGKTFYKIFGSWSGGYLDGDSWRLNSGVESYTEGENGWIDFVGASGSVYECHKYSEGVRSAHNQGVLAEILAKAPEEVDAAIISYAEFKEQFNK